MARRDLFDGASGRVLAAVMARRNRDSEEEAIEVLGPRPADSVVCIGVGPGIGISRLAAHCTEGRIAGVDPSAVMVAQSRRRNRTALESGQVELVQTAADCLPWPGGHFDGAIGVNSIHLWRPLEASVAEVARVLRPEGRLVTLTHDWAIK